MSEENVLKTAIANSILSEYDEMYEQADDESDFSKGFEKKMDKLISRRKKPYYIMINTAFKRVAVFIIAFISISVVTVLSVDALRDFFKDLFVNIFSDHSHVVANTEPEVGESSMTITYPEKIESKYEIKTGEAGYDSVNLLSRSYAEDLNIKTAYGKWLDEEDPDDEYIDLVACSDMGHSVGDIVDLKITNKDLQDPLEYDYCKGKIIGIVYKNANEGDYGTTVQRNDMFSVDEILSFQGTDFFAVYPEDDQRLKNNDMFELEKGSIIVTLKEDLSDDERKEFLSTAAKEHYTADSLKEFYDRTYNHDLKLFKNDIVFLTLAFMIAVVAIIGVSVLNIAKERRTYSIYCLYGMTTKDCTLINAIYTMMILLVSGTISLIVKAVSAYREYADDFEIYERVRREFEAEGLPFINKTIKYSDYFRLQPSYIWLLAGLFVVSFICSMIVPYLSLKKLDIVSEIKQED